MNEQRFRPSNSVLTVTLASVVIASLLWSLRSSAPEPDVSERASGVSTSSPIEPMPTIERASELVVDAAPATTTPEESSSFLSLRLRMIENGNPAVGIRVRVWEEEPLASEDDEALFDSLTRTPPLTGTDWTSDGEGRIRAEVQSGVHRIALLDPFFGLMSSARYPAVTASEEASEGFVDVWVRAGGAVRGRLVNPHGAPVVDARVWMLQNEILFGLGKSGSRSDLFPSFFDPGNFVCTRTDSDGRFVLNGIHPRGRGTLTAVPVGWAPVILDDVEVVAFSTTDLGTLVAATAASIEVRLLGSPPTKGWTVRCSQVAQPAPPARTESPTAGAMSALLDGLRPGTYQVSVFVPERQPAKTMVAELKEGEMRAIEIASLEGALLRGIVLDSRGLPVPEAKVAVVAQRSSSHTTTAADGSFAFDSLPEGSVMLTVAKVGRGSAKANAVAPASDLVIRLERGAVLRGRVVPPPTEADRVDLQLESWSGRVPARTSSRVDIQSSGEFEIEGLPAGRHRLIASMRDAAGTSGWIELAADEERNGISITLERSLTVLGTLADSATGRPIPGAWVGIDDPTAGRDVDITNQLLAGWFGVPEVGSGKRVRTSPDGAFRIQGVPAANWSIRASHPDHRPSPWVALPPADAEGVVRVALTLQSALRLEGVVRDARGSPIVDGFVGLFPPDASTHSPPLRFTNTDEHGRYSLTVSSGGDYQVRVSRGNSREFVDTPVRIAEQGVTVRDLVH